MNIKPTKHYNVLKGCCSNTETATSVSGEAQIENPDKSALVELRIFGESFQPTYSGVNGFNLNGTIIQRTAPYQIEGNKLKVSNNVGYTTAYVKYGEIPVTGGGEYTFTAKINIPADYPSNANARIILRGVNNNGTEVQTVSFPSRVVSVTETKTFNLREDVISLSIELYSWSSVRATEKFTVVFEEIMLVLGSELPNEYQPYVGLAYSPSTAYPQTVYGVMGNGSKLAFYNGQNLLKQIDLPNQATKGVSELKVGLYGIDNVKDELYFNSKQKKLIYTKRIGYIDSYNGEEVGSDYISSCGELTTGAKVIYKLNQPQTTDLSEYSLINVFNTCIPSGANRIVYIGKVEPNFNLKYKKRI